MQSQVLLVNGYYRLRCLPKLDLHRLSESLPARGSTASTTLPAQVLSGLLCIPARTVENTVGHVMRQGRPKPREGHRSQCQEAGAAADAAAPVPAAALEGAEGTSQVPASALNLLRATLFVSTHGLPKALLPNILQLIALAKGDIGTSRHTRRFQSVAEAAADQLVLNDTARILGQPLPATGLPPDVELFCDGGSVGHYYSRGGDQLLVVGVTTSTPWPPYSTSLLVACLNERADGRAASVAAHLARAFEGLHSGSFSQWRDQRIAVAVGDQALAPGGVENQSQRLGLRLMWEGTARCRRDVADVFHLINRAGNKACSQEPFQQLASLLKDLEHVFGCGHGRYVDRSVSAFLHLQHWVCKTPCGTRKTGYLSGVPERFLDKFSTFFFGILVRMRHSLAGRGSYTFAWLKGLGSRMSTPTVLCFAFGLAAGFRHHLYHLTLRSQDCADLPWARWRALQDQGRQMKALPAKLGWWRRHLFFVALLEPYLAAADPTLRRLVQAWCLSPHGRCVCVVHRGLHLGWQLYEIFLSGVYAGCQLHVAMTPPPVGTRLVHPACQCPTRPQLRPGSALATRRGGDIRDPSRVTLQWAGRRRAVRAPWWVSCSLYSQKALQDSSRLEGPGTCSLRYQTVLPAQHGHANRSCQVPFRAAAALRQLETGLFQLQVFWRALAVDFERCCYGDLGVSKEMQDIWGAMAVCLWLPDMVEHGVPTPMHLNALQVLYRHLKPDLQLRPWPPQEFHQTPPQRRWPTEVGIAHFYKIWWGKIHTAAHAPEMGFHTRWRRAVAYSVLPLFVSFQAKLVACAIMGAMPFLRRGRLAEHMRSDVCLLAARVQDHLSGTPGHVFTVRPEEMRAFGRGPRNAAMAPGAVGAMAPGAVVASRLAVLRTPRLRGRVVHVLHPVLEWDQREMAASLEQNRYFSDGCYHMNRLFCLARRFGSTEAPVERWVGGLKYLFDPIQGPTTTTLVQRLRLRAFGIRGDGADDAWTSCLSELLGMARSLNTTGTSRALKHFSEQASGRVEQEAPWLLQSSTSPPMPEAYKTMERRLARTRHVHEPDTLEEDDRQLLEHEQRNREAKLPLFASTGKQWAEDRRKDRGTLLRTDRARAELATATAEATAAHSSARSAWTQGATGDAAESSTSDSVSSSSSSESAADGAP